MAVTSFTDDFITNADLRPYQKNNLGKINDMKMLDQKSIIINNCYANH